MLAFERVLAAGCLWGGEGRSSSLGAGSGGVGVSGGCVGGRGGEEEVSRREGRARRGGAAAERLARGEGERVPMEVGTLVRRKGGGLGGGGGEVRGGCGVGGREGL